MSVCLNIYLIIHSPVCLSVRLFVCKFICLPACLFVKSMTQCLTELNVKQIQTWMEVNVHWSEKWHGNYVWSISVYRTVKNHTNRRLVSVTERLWNCPECSDGDDSPQSLWNALCGFCSNLQYLCLSAPHIRPRLASDISLTILFE